MPLKEVAEGLGVNYFTMWEWVTKTRPRRQEARKRRVASKVHKDRTKLYNRDYARRRYQEELYFAQRSNLNSLVSGSIRGRWRRGKAADLLGLSPLLLAKQWDELHGAGWEQRYSICRRRPCSSFDLVDTEQQKVCYNWRNLILLPRMQEYTRDTEWTAQDEADWAWRMRSMGYEGELFLVFLGPREEE